MKVVSDRFYIEDTMPAKQVKGIFSICPTPFDDKEEVDYESIESLVNFKVQTGVNGLAILGFLGELHKLSNSERKAVAKTFLECAQGRLPVWVGIRALGLKGAIEQAVEAQEIGAEAVFVAPPDAGSDDYLFKYYAEIAKSVDVPVVIHDFPASFGTEVTAAVVARLGREGGVHIIKMEEQPVAQKISSILDQLNDPSEMSVFGGLGGVYFLEELQRGAAGTMTGFAFPEILIAIYQRYTAGDEQGAAQLFDKYLPLIRYEFQPKLGLALRKHIYKRRGAIKHENIRSPGMRMDDRTVRELEAIVHRVGLSLDVHGRQDV